MAAGSSASEKASQARRAADRRRAEAERAERAAAAWERGSAGEQALAAALSALEPDGYVAIHDRAIPGRKVNVDHLLVGPAGVVAIDAKAWTGDLRMTGRTLTQNGRNRSAVISDAHAYGTTIAEHLDALGDSRTPVWSALCFVGEGRIGPDRNVVDRVRLLDIDQVVDWVRSLPPALSAARIEETRRQLANAFPAKSAEASDPSTAAAPDDLVVYLFPWKKYGRHRLYVRSNDGHDVGYLDLVSGQVSSPSAEWEQILMQLLPHYVFGDSPHAADMSIEAQGVLRRILDTFRRRSSSAPAERPIIACYRWRKHGKDRLYINRLESGAKKSDMGFFDLDTGFVKTGAAGATSVLGYCGQRFQQLELGSSSRA